MAYHELKSIWRTYISVQLPISIESCIHLYILFAACTVYEVVFILRMSGPATRQMAPRPRNTSVSDFPYNENFARVALIAFGRSISDGNNDDFISDLNDWLASISKDWKFRLTLFAWRFDTSLNPSITISGVETRREALRAAWQESKYSKDGHVFEQIHAFISTFERILVSFVRV